MNRDIIGEGTDIFTIRGSNLDFSGGNFKFYL